MARGDFYASPFGAAYSAYMERPRLSRLIARTIWGGDIRPYYDRMSAVAEVNDGGTIVDCPCGAGPALRALRPNADVRYVAADLSPSMLQRARKRARARGLTAVEFVEADAADLPLERDTADLFLSLWGLHCFKDPAAAIRDAARVLKPSGRIVGACFVRGGETPRQRLLVRPGRGDFGKVGTQAELEHWLVAAGLALSDSKRSGPMWFFDAQRRYRPATGQPPAPASGGWPR
jgi:SAM-dependent methyltransferase